MSRLMEVIHYPHRTHCSNRTGDSVLLMNRSICSLSSTQTHTHTHTTGWSFVWSLGCSRSFRSGEITNTQNSV